MFGVSSGVSALFKVEKHLLLTIFKLLGLCSRELIARFFSKLDNSPRPFLLA